MRERKLKAIDYTGHKFDNGVVLSEHSIGNWNVECSNCGEIHIYNTRAIKNNSKSRQCSKFKPHNWTGVDNRKDGQLRRYYGVTLKEMQYLIEFQNSECGICGCEIDLDKRDTHIDHDHETGEVRGILCNSCNTGIGHLGDNIEGLRNALYYLSNEPYREFLNTQMQDKEKQCG